MSTNSAAGDTVIPTKTSKVITRSGELGFPGIDIERLDILARAESTPVARKRHRQEPSSSKTEVPVKSSKRDGETLGRQKNKRHHNHGYEPENARLLLLQTTRGTPMTICVNSVDNIDSRILSLAAAESRPDLPRRNKNTKRLEESGGIPRKASEDNSEGRRSPRKILPDGSGLKADVQHPQPEVTVTFPPTQRLNQQQHLPKRRDEAVRLRKTIQWLEEGARRMREDLAMTRAELGEERKAARLARRELDVAVKDAKTGEATRYLRIISELKSRLAQSPTRPVLESTSPSAKAKLLIDDNHRRGLSVLRKRLAEAEASVQRLKSSTSTPHGHGKRVTNEDVNARKAEVEVQFLRAANRKLEERLQVVADAEKTRAAELRVQHENHETQLAVLQRTLRGDTIRMMDEIRSKTREIEKLERLVLEGSQMYKKLLAKKDDLMRKLRETERSNQIRLTPRIGEISNSTEHVAGGVCTGVCEAAAEVERLRELGVEQEEVIEVLRQAVKEKERKLEQICNKKRKEEFYKQWLELEPVVEVDDEEEHEEGDSALSSAPSSLSPQPGGCGQWQHTDVTKEAYETVLLRVEELQTRLVEEQRELTHAKSQVRDLEMALLQETRGSQNSRRALSEKLREMEDREASLMAEVTELREQNELLEFRVLELEETPCLRDTPDPADSGIVSPEPIHLYKEQLCKQRDRAVATVIPYHTYACPVSPIPQKTPLSLQESGIFDEDDEGHVELASCGTQTDTPAGDLLQEVRRLHELRARIQERAVKVPVPVVEARVSSPSDLCDVPSPLLQANSNQSYQVRIRELEQRLATYEEAERNRVHAKKLSKQREEELLDENYRLTETIYWFENALRNHKNTVLDFSGNQEIVECVSHVGETHRDSHDSVKKRSDAQAEVFKRTDIHTSTGFNRRERSLGDDVSSGRYRGNGKTGSNEIGKLDVLAQEEFLAIRGIVDLECQEADETCPAIEHEYSTQLDDLRFRMDGEILAKEVLLRRGSGELEDRLKQIEENRVLGECQLTEMKEKDDDSTEPGLEISAPMDVDEVHGETCKSDRPMNLVASSEMTVMATSGPDTMREIEPWTVLVAAELAIEAKEKVATSIVESVENETEEIVNGSHAERLFGDGEFGGRQVRLGNAVDEEPVVTINEIEPETKVIYFRWR